MKGALPMSQEEGQVQEPENERDQKEEKEKAGQEAKDKNEKSEEGKSDSDGSPPENCQIRKKPSQKTW